MIIGLTGGIGSGKSTVAHFFEHKGIPVFNADKVAKSLYEDPKVVAGMVSILGNEILINEKIDLKKLAQIIFQNTDKRNLVNEYIHPLVKLKFKEWMESLNETIPYCIREAAILIESGSYKDCDAVIMVTADEELRIQRVMKRDHVSREQVIQRINAQMNDNDRKKFVHYIIVNNDLQSTQKQVDELHSLLINLKQHS